MTVVQCIMESFAQVPPVVSQHLGCAQNALGIYLLECDEDLPCPPQGAASESAADIWEAAF